MTNEHTFLQKAIDFATLHHGDVTRKFSKQLYIEHPKRVSRALAHRGLIVQIAGVYHDLVEDTEVTLEDIKKSLPFLSNDDVLWVVTYVDALTKKQGENYKDFIMRVIEQTSIEPAFIKLADIEDNMSDLSEGSLKDKYRLAKYILEQHITSKGFNLN